jgi:hypothetical protein
MKMKRSCLMTGLFLCTAVVLAAAPIRTSRLLAKPATNTSPATYVTSAEIDAALRQMPPNTTTYDKPIKTVDTGAYKVTIEAAHRLWNCRPNDGALAATSCEVRLLIS